MSERTTDYHYDQGSLHGITSSISQHGGAV